MVPLPTPCTTMLQGTSVQLPPVYKWRNRGSDCGGDLPKSRLPSGRARAGTRAASSQSRAPLPPGHPLQVGHRPRECRCPARSRGCREHAVFEFSLTVRCPCWCPICSVDSSLQPLVPSAQSRLHFSRGKIEPSFPQEPMTSRGDPTMSFGGRRPRSSRRPTNLWGIGATRTCSEPRSEPPLSACLSVRATDLSAVGPLQALHLTSHGIAPFP